MLILYFYNGFLSQSGYEKLKDFPVPFWLALFVEGTRFTQPKLLDAQKYAISKGFDAPKNVLLPRTKVYISLFLHLGPFLPPLVTFLFEDLVLTDYYEMYKTYYTVN